MQKWDHAKSQFPTKPTPPTNITFSTPHFCRRHLTTLQIEVIRAGVLKHQLTHFGFHFNFHNVEHHRTFSGQQACHEAYGHSRLICSRLLATFAFRFANTICIVDVLVLAVLHG